MYNLCFIARRPFDDLSPAVYKQIKADYDKDAKGVFITMDSKETAYIAKQFPENDITIVELSEFMNAHWDEFNLAKLSDYEEKYECAPMWEYIYTDRFLIERDYDYVVRTACGLFAFWEYIFTTHEIHFYYDEVVATLFTYVAYIVGKKLGVDCFSLMLMRAVGMDLTHHYVLNDPFEMAMDLPVDWENVELTDEELSRAESYLAGFEEKHSKPAIMQFSNKKPHITKDFFILPIFYLRQRFFNPHTRDKGSYIYYKAYEHTMDPIKFYFRYQKSKKYFKKADMTKKYVYFPLHLQPEASTIVCAQKYEKQLYFLDNLAKSLPADTLIYCKEHYSFLGSRDNSFYEAFSQYPNIVLVDPWEDSIELTLHSQCVVTLTGTAGQEAMMLRKPVIIGGNIFYENAPGVTKVDDIYLHYLDSMAAYEKPSREQVVRFLAAYMKCARPGNTYGWSPARLEPDNIKLIAKSMFDYFSQRGQVRLAQTTK